MRKVFIISAAVILLIGAAIFIGRGYISRQFFKPTPTAFQEGFKIDAGQKNTDGRGEPRQGDDKIIKVNPALFQPEDANNLQPQNSGDTQKEQKVSAEIFPAKTAEEKLIIQNVPFVPQAPLGNWQDERQENACEEASALMAMRWAENRKLTLEEAEKEIIAISEYERNNFGDFHDTSAADTVERIFKGYFGYENAELRNNIGIGDIKQEIFAGNILIVPVNGRKLRNPYYTPPGPIEHQLVIIGYDEAAKEFVTNDSGTRRGEKYRYPENIIEQALQDYPTGFHEPIERINKEMIIVKRRP